MMQYPDYAAQTFENFADLNQNKPELAQELVNNYGEGPWQDDEITVYDTVDDYAYYELTEGWYADQFAERDYNGAPDPLDFIDLHALGQKLYDTGDESMTYQADDGAIVTTPEGWQK